MVPAEAPRMSGRTHNVAALTVLQGAPFSCLLVALLALTVGGGVVGAGVDPPPASKMYR